MVAILKKVIKFASILTMLLPGKTMAAIIDNPTGGMPNNITFIEEIIKRAQNLILAVSGAIAVSMIIWGAIILITAGGNEERVAKGKKILTYSIGGVIFIIASYTLIRIFILLLGGNV
jgi:hypothetical protein